MSSITRASLALACGTLLFGVVVPTCVAVGKHCPPPYVHCQEGPPKIKFKCACPRPVCSPCDSPFFGYYPTCWSPWGAGCPNCPSRNPPWVPPPAEPIPDGAGVIPYVGPAYTPGAAAPGAMEVVPGPGGPVPAPRLDSDGRPTDSFPAPTPMPIDEGPRLKPMAAQFPVGSPGRSGSRGTYGRR